MTREMLLIRSNLSLCASFGLSSSTLYILSSPFSGLDYNSLPCLLFGVPLLLLSSSISIYIFFGPTSGLTYITLICGGGELSLPMSKTLEAFKPEEVSLIDFF
jgi:hypothetical protein